MFWACANAQRATAEINRRRNARMSYSSVKILDGGLSRWGGPIQSLAETGSVGNSVGVYIGAVAGITRGKQGWCLDSLINEGTGRRPLGLALHCRRNRDPSAAMKNADGRDDKVGFSLESLAAARTCSRGMTIKMGSRKLASRKLNGPTTKKR